MRSLLVTLLAMVIERDAAATKARLLSAARAEFAAFGFAGARIDRIAAAAHANKQLIYVYFKSKAQLFELVSTSNLAGLLDAAHFDAQDLASYVGRLFDYMVDHPDMLRLRQWANLEHPTSVAAFEQESYRNKLDAIAQAQRNGQITTAYTPTDLLTLLIGLASAWFTVAEALRTSDTTAPWSPERLAQFRTAAVAAAQRIVSERAE